MPLLYVQPEPPPTPPKVWPKVAVPPPKRVIWIGPDGSVHRFSDGGALIGVTGRAGFGRIKPDVATQAAASGAHLLQDYRESPRVMTVPCVLDASTPQEYLAAWRSLVASTRHRFAGEVRTGRVRVELPDGTWRDSRAVYQGGLETREDVLDDMLWSRSEHPNLEFYASDPGFYGPEISLEWRLVAEHRRFYPLYPVRVGSSRLGGQAAITSPSDDDSYPVWEVDGPGMPIVTNAATGQTWGFGQTIPEGTTVTVDCRPQDHAPDTGLTALDQDGVDWWQNFAGLPELWSIPPGTTNLSVAMSGATTASRLRLRFEPRYQAGW